jgi:hypothetical protein
MFPISLKIMPPDRPQEAVAEAAGSAPCSGTTQPRPAVTYTAAERLDHLASQRSLAYDRATACCTR